MAWCRRTQDTAALPLQYTVTQTVTLAITVNTQHRTPKPHRCGVWIPVTKKKKYCDFYKTNSISQALHLTLTVHIKYFKIEVLKCYPIKCCSCSDPVFADVATLISGTAAVPFHADRGRASLSRRSGLNGHISCLSKRRRHKESGQMQPNSHKCSTLERCFFIVEKGPKTSIPPQPP